VESESKMLDSVHRWAALVDLRSPKEKNPILKKRIPTQLGHGHADGCNGRSVLILFGFCCTWASSAECTSEGTIWEEDLVPCLPRCRSAYRACTHLCIELELPNWSCCHCNFFEQKRGASCAPLRRHDLSIHQYWPTPEIEPGLLHLMACRELTVPLRR